MTDHHVAVEWCVTDHHVAVEWCVTDHYIAVEWCVTDHHVAVEWCVSAAVTTEQVSSDQSLQSLHTDVQRSHTSRRCFEAEKKQHNNNLVDFQLKTDHTQRRHTDTLSCSHDLDIELMTLRDESDLDIPMTYVHTDNEHYTSRHT